MEMRSLTSGAPAVAANLLARTGAVILLLLPFSASAQKKTDMGHGHAVLSASGRLAEHDPDEAIRQLASVHRSDSLYERVLIRQYKILTDRDRYDEALALCSRALKEKLQAHGAFMLMRTAALIDSERFAEAVPAADSTIQELPALFRPRHLRAVALAGAGDKKAALQQALENARRFPYSRDAHILLGTIAFNEGHTAEAALALAMAQIVRFDDTMAENLLGYYDGVLGGRVQAKPAGYDMRSTGDDLAEEDALLKNQVAMGKSYKVKPDLPYPMCRQTHLLFSSIQKQGRNTGAYTALYGPLVKDIMEQGLFEGFVYHCLMNSSDSKIRGAAVKNKAKVEDFRKRIGEVVRVRYAGFADTKDGPELMHYFNSDGDLFGHGPGDVVKNEKWGDWTYYHGSGRRSAAGTFSRAGKREGTWLNWYENGSLKSRAEYNEGDMNGTFLIYNENGSLKDSSTVAKGERMGRFCFYHAMGGRKNCKTSDGSQLNGPVEEYHPTGTVEWSYTVVNGNTEGVVKQFFPDGSRRYEGQYQKDERHGVQTTYHPNGQPSREYTYAAGKGEGPFKEWHANGQLSLEGTMKAGKYTGDIRTYDEWGTLTLVRRYDDQGRLQGVRESYNNDGTRHMDMEYNKDLLVRYRYYDRTGKVLGEGTRSKGKFAFKGYHPDGGLSVEGVYMDEGSKEGLWKYYYEDGTLDTEENFEKGELAGKQRYHRVNGDLSAEYEVYTRNGTTYRAFKRFHPTGGIRQEGVQNDGSLEGEFRRYYADGTLETVEYYLNDSRQGWQDFLDPDGKLNYSELIQDKAYMERVNYDDAGVPYERIRVQPGSFELVQHYPTGEVMARFAMLNGYFHGKSTWYYPNGKVELEGDRQNGERVGKWTSYHPNGKKAYEREYRGGKIHGLERRWYHDGEVFSETPYVDGQIHGLVKEYYLNGKLSHTEEYEYGEYHGRRTNYTHAEVPQMVRFYHKNRLVAYGSPAADGSVKDTVRVSGGIVDLETRFPDKTLSRRMRYRNGEIDGEFTEYHANGKVMKRVTYVGGTIVGSSQEFFADGKEHMVIPYLEGKKHGEQLVYWDNGQLRERITWKGGEMQGPRTFHDRTGKKITTYRMRSDDVVEIIR
jgi:uncharacterized protein